MALNEYPIRVAHADYHSPGPMNEPDPPPGGAELHVAVSGFTKLKRKVKGTTLRPAAVTHPGAAHVCVIEPDRKTSSQSFDDSMGGWPYMVFAPANAAALVVDQAQVFCFAPGVDEPRVGFSVLNTSFVQSVTFEVFCKANGATPIHTVNWATMVERRQLLMHPISLANGTVARGSVLLSDILAGLDTNQTVGGDPDPAFPDGHLTLHYSPYQIRLTVNPIGGHTAYPSTAWTYVHVVAQSIQVDWFPYKSATDKAKLALFLPTARRAKEMTLYGDLTDKKEDYNLNGQFPAAGDVKKVPLEGNRFYREERELQDNSGYEQWKLHWGDGPNIPVKASVLIRSMKNKAVEAPLALANAWMMWSYKDDAQPLSREGAALGPGGAVPVDNGTIPTFLSNSQDYLAAKPADDASPSGKNCHVHRGGKRGVGGHTVFPVQAGTAAATLPAAVTVATDAQQFPFTVQRCATRLWAARSRFRSSGELAGQTGILFQPSRMGGDAYKLHVALAIADLYDEMDDNVETVLDAAPPNLAKLTGTLEVWRQVYFAKYLNAVDQLIDYDLIRQKMERNFIWLKIQFPKPVRLKVAELHAAYEQVRTDGASPVENYVRAAMLDPAQLAAALVKDVDLDGDYSGKTNASAYLIPFLPYQLWKTKMIQIHGNWANAVLWSYGVNHPQEDYWRQRSGTQVPISDPWPVNFVSNINPLGTAGKLDITIRPHHIGGQAGLIVPNTRIAQIDDNGALSPLDKGVIDPAWVHVWNHVTYSGNDHYHTADAGLNNRDGLPRNTPIDVEVSGLAVPQARYDAIKQYIEDKVQTYADSGMRRQYRQCCGYQWVFAVIAEVNAQLIGPGASGFTVLSVSPGILNNYRHPNGKAMFANAARNAACIPIMNNNDDTTYHEFCHSMFLNHTDQPTNDVYKLHQDGWDAGSIMKAVGARQATLEGFHMLRTRGWSFLQTDAVGDVPAGCYTAAGPGALPEPGVGDDTTQQAWWNANCNNTVRTLHGDGTRNQV